MAAMYNSNIMEKSFDHKKLDFMEAALRQLEDIRNRLIDDDLSSVRKLILDAENELEKVIMQM